MAQDEGSSSRTAKEPTQEDKVEKADESARLGIESDNLVGGDDPDDTKLLGGINPPDGDIKSDDRTGSDHQVQNARFEDVQDFETTVGKETGMIALADTNVIGCLDAQAKQDTSKYSQECLTTNLECSEYVYVRLREACEKTLNGTKEEQRDILSTTGKTEDVVATVREIHEDIDVQESVVA